MVEYWGSIDILLNFAGGNVPGATIREDQNVFDVKFSDWEKITQLNGYVTVFPSLVFGKVMAQKVASKKVGIKKFTATGFS